MRILLVIALLIWPASVLAEDRSFRLGIPEDLIASGFDKHVFTRFKFKHRITVVPVSPAGDADARLLPGEEGARMFQSLDGQTWRLARGDDPDGYVRTFSDWLKSGPGKSAIESFAPEGTQLFTTEATVVVAKAEEVFEGDALDGGRLALVHCGRCHVVDKRNRMGGIGSTPSFAALRGRSNWSDLFRAFWTHNPHPSFTQVEGLTEPFTEDRVSHITPIEMTPEELEAITAFVATITPKDLGRPVQSN